GGRVRIDRALATLRAEGKGAAALADVAELERAGLAHRRGDTIAIDRATADAAEAVAGGEAIARPAASGPDAARDGTAPAAAPAYRDAAVHARAAEAAGADPVAARLIAARAAQRAGELDAAEAALAALHAAHPGHPEVAGSYARLLVTRSRYREARAIATAA